MIVRSHFIQSLHVIHRTHAEHTLLIHVGTPEWLGFGTAGARIFNRMGSDFESPAHPQGRVQHYSDYFNQAAPGALVVPRPNPARSRCPWRPPPDPRPQRMIPGGWGAGGRSPGATEPPGTGERDPGATPLTWTPVTSKVGHSTTGASINPPRCFDALGGGPKKPGKFPHPEQKRKETVEYFPPAGSSVWIIFFRNHSCPEQFPRKKSLEITISNQVFNGPQKTRYVIYM